MYQDDRVVYSRAYGMANLDHDVPLTPASVFHVASVSKQFTAAAILLLAQDGKLSVDDEVRKYIPELPDFGQKITIRHLVHHTSGIRDQWALLGFAGWRYSRDLITDDDVLALLSRQKALNFTPGERHLYSNSGYTLLAVIVSRVSGKIVPAVHHRADFSAARHDEHALPRQLQRDREEPGVRLRGGPTDLPPERHQLRHRGRNQPADDGGGPGEVARELRQEDQSAATS